LSQSETSNEIQRRVLGVVEEVTGEDIDQVDLDSDITETLVPSSLDQVTLFLAMGDEFGATIPEEEAGDLKTLRQIIDFIEQRMAQDSG
jgi:acyl carrier protein